MINEEFFNELFDLIIYISLGFRHLEQQKNCS